MYKIIVTGSRFWDDELTVRRRLNELTKFIDDAIVLVNGKAPGADTIAREYALSRGWVVEDYIADWSKGKSAGPLRNKAMIESLPKADLVVAFAQQCVKLEHAKQAPHMSHGTKSAIDIAEANLLPVVIVKG